MKITISYNGGRFVANIIKSAFLSSGYCLYLFKRHLKGFKPSFSGEYVVAFKSPDSTTADCVSTNSFKTAINLYSDYLCFYS